ncbi:hypothetical protein RCL_jg20965.t1 [Rhizophagus clarus]|uniref:Uncharacterized protein n=1 Tax=Rhizophagus clarus TaxID=94130 RepID=A0A8H3LJ62_9GLOM|nr:hypothetical protein RCL_jg20965.t1 [Rhizophagus clarus]
MQNISTAYVKLLKLPNSSEEIVDGINTLIPFLNEGCILVNSTKHFTFVGYIYDEITEPNKITESATATLRFTTRVNKFSLSEKDNFVISIVFNLVSAFLCLHTNGKS